MGRPNIHCLYQHEGLLTPVSQLTMETAAQEMAFDLVEASVTQQQFHFSSPACQWQI